ncbi:MAG TPA: sterol desaturase family protein [Chthoniobacterales bacterium]|jgi:sterol desaturase/sphingolipid hydroxylase (fatty acid hydroxylase superfamily)
MSRRYISNKNETVRMFESDFLEFFSHVHPVVPWIIYLPLIGWMFELALVEREFSPGKTASLFVLGLFLWTLVEYVMHRWVFHYQPRSAWGKRLHFMMHGVHHDYPKDASRLVMPPSVSLPLAAVFYGLFFLAFGRLAPAIFAGLLAGYLFYDTVHYATHHFAMKRGVWRWLKQYHMRHHYQDDEVGYGVSSPIWDYVFGTREDERTGDEDIPASVK